MQDRFKFRAWDKNKKIMIYDAERTYDGLVGVEDWNAFVDVLNDDNYIVEQCTGLKDKNGRLIYENDIVKLSGKYEIGVYSIIYNVSCCDYELTKNDKFIYEFYWEVAENCEVIGNIHENGDLLNED